jgi:hypothetical protein
MIAAVRAHVASIPGTTWPVSARPPGPIPGPKTRPGFDAKFSFRHVISDSLTFVFPNPT